MPFWHWQWVLFFGSYVSHLSYRETAKQTELSQINSSPYFEITAVMDGDKQTGYVIENSGGYIQSANVTLKSVINTYVRNFGGEDFYFEFQNLSKSYADLKDTDIVVDLHESNLGMKNWKNPDEGAAGEISKDLAERDIFANIYYMEFLELQYLDKNRELHNEQYMIGVNKSGELLLLPVPPEIALITNQINAEYSRDIETYENSFKRKVGSSGGASSPFRGTVTYDYFVYGVVETLENYKAEFE